MIIQIIKFETSLSEDEVMAVAKDRADQFRALPGLIQKYYIALDKPDQYGGIYVWDSEQSLKAYRKSDLASSIPEAYKVKGTPYVEIANTLLQLRD